MTKPSLRIDVSGTTCPMTFVKVKVALEGIEPGAILEAILNGEDHPEAIPPSVREDGHEVVSIEPWGDRTLIRIRRGDDAR